MRRCEGKEPTPTPKGVGSGASTVPRVPKCQKKTKGLWLRVLLPFRILKKPRFLGRTSGKHPPLPANQANQAQPRPCDTWHIKPEQFYGLPHQKKKRAGEKRRVPPTCSGDTLGAGRNSANSLFSKPCRNVENCSKLLPCKPANGPLIAH